MPAVVVILLRIVAVAAMLSIALFKIVGRHEAPSTTKVLGEQLPLYATGVASTLYFVLLALYPLDAGSRPALMLAIAGATLAVAGAAVAFKSRIDLGAAWSYVPKAGTTTGLVTAGIYRRVRHPIYLGITLIIVGDALAFGNWPALVTALVAGVACLVWRARVEERLLIEVFGDAEAEELVRGRPAVTRSQQPTQSLGRVTPLTCLPRSPCTAESGYERSLAVVS